MNFQGEIFRKGNIASNQPVYLGSVRDCNEDILVYWNEDGQCHQGKGSFLEDFRLTPSEEVWYKNPDNFPTIIVGFSGTGMVVVHYYEDGYVYDARDKKYAIINGAWQRASNDEIESLKY